MAESFWLALRWYAARSAHNLDCESSLVMRVSNRTSEAAGEVEEDEVLLPDTCELIEAEEEEEADGDFGR